MDLIKIFIKGVVFLGLSSSVLTQLNRSAENQLIEFLDTESNSTRIINMLQAPQLDLVILADTKDINAYLLFTRSNPTLSQQLFPEVITSVQESNFNPSDQTVVIVHGWTGDRNSPVNLILKDAFLRVLYANVIVVDWSKLAQEDYITASAGTPAVGRNLGKFLEFLNEEAGAPYNTMHVIGFSLGAHVAGNAGKYLKGHVARITGLDPAGPLWELNAYKLSSSDAVYVEAIHTDGSLLGTTGRSGHVDFYPNGGLTQPDCAPAQSSCSHSRSWQLFAVTIVHDNLVGRRCESEVAFDLNMCYGDRLHMGNDDLLKKGNGKYRLNTSGEYPYFKAS